MWYRIFTLPLYCPHWITVMWCGLGIRRLLQRSWKQCKIMLLVQLWELLTDHQQLHWEPNWAAKFREKMGAPHCNQARTFPGPPYLHDLFQPIQKQYKHHTWLSKESTEHIRTWCPGPFVIKELLYGTLFQTISKVLSESTFVHALNLFYASSCK